MVEFRDIPGTNGLYKATNDCRIWSEVQHRFLKQRTDKCGYKHVDIKKNGVRMPYRVNRLVFEAFYRQLQPNEEAHHINQIRDDNRPINLVAKDKVVHVTMHDTGVKQSKETIMKRTKSMLETKEKNGTLHKQAWNKGKSWSQQTRLKMRLAKLGKKRGVVV